MATQKTIGAINVDITARTQKFNKGVNDARKSIKGLTSSFRMIGGALSALFVSNQVINGVRRFRDEMDELAKTASKLGVEFEKLQELQFVAERQGVGARTLNMAIQRMARRISEAAKGTGEARGALAELGLDPQAIARLNPADQLHRIADAMQDVRSQTDQLRLAFKLFDSEGVAMVNMLRDGSEGMRLLQARARALGGVIEASVVKEAERAKDAWTDLGMVLKGRVGAGASRLMAATTPVAELGVQAIAGRDILRSETEMRQRQALNRLAEQQQKELRINRLRRMEAAKRENAKLPKVRGATSGGFMGVNLLGQNIGGLMQAQQLAVQLALAGAGPNIGRFGPQPTPIPSGAYGAPVQSLAERMMAKYMQRHAMPGMLTLQRAGTAGAFRQQADIRRSQERFQMEKERTDALKAIQTAVEEGLPIVPLGLGE